MMEMGSPASPTLTPPATTASTLPVTTASTSPATTATTPPATTATTPPAITATAPPATSVTTPSTTATSKLSISYGQQRPHSRDSARSCSFISPIFKSPGLMESIQVVTDIVRGLKTAVESMDKRLESVENLFKEQLHQKQLTTLSTPSPQRQQSARTQVTALSTPSPQRQQSARTQVTALSTPQKQQSAPLTQVPPTLPPPSASPLPITYPNTPTTPDFSVLSFLNVPQPSPCWYNTSSTPVVERGNKDQDKAGTEPDVDVLNMSIEEWFKLKNNSASRKNFSAKLVRMYFTKEERMKSNVRGKGGKDQLNPVKIEYVKNKTFEMWPLQTGEVEKKAWAACVCAIDEANRRLNRKN